MKKIMTIGFLQAALLVSTSCEANKTGSPEIRANYRNAPTYAKETNASWEKSYMHVKTSDPIKDIIHHSAFDGFGEFILPLSRVASLMPYHGHVNPEAAADTINAMIDEVVQIHFK